MNSFIKFFITGVLVCTSIVASAQQFPTVTTGDASDREATSAVLNGAVTLTEEVPFGQFYFQYGRNTNYGSQTARRSVTEDRTFSQAISGLNEETGYNFRAVLVGSDGTSYFGSNKSFVTPSELDPVGNTPPPLEAVLENINRTNGTSGAGTTGGATGSTNTSGAQATPQVIDAGCIDPAGDCDGDGLTNGLERGTGDTLRNSDGDDPADYLDPYSHGQVAGADGRIPVDGAVPGVRERLQTENGTQPGTTVGAQGGGIGGVGGFNFGGAGSAPSGAAGDSNIDEVVDRGLIPCGNGDEANEADRTCTFRHAVILIQNIINFIVVFSIFIGVALIVYGGILYLRDGGSSSNVSKAKGIFMNVAIGYFFVLCAWLIVNFIVSPQSEGGSGLISDEFQAQLDDENAANNLDLLNDN